MAEQRPAKLEPLGWPLIRLALVIVLGGVAPLVDTTIVNVALPTFAVDFRVGTTAVQWVTTGYLLAIGLTMEHRTYRPRAHPCIPHLHQTWDCVSISR